MTKFGIAMQASRQSPKNQKEKPDKPTSNFRKEISQHNFPGLPPEKVSG